MSKTNLKFYFLILTLVIANGIEKSYAQSSSPARISERIIRTHDHNAIARRHAADQYFQVSLGYRGQEVSFRHAEILGATGSLPLDQELFVPEHFLQLGLSAEIFPISPVSLSFEGIVAKEVNGLMNQNETRFEYTNQIDTLLYGAGASLNGNIFGLGLKIQPFLGANYMIAQREYELSFKQKSTTAVPSTILSYKNDQQFAEYKAGLRFIDPVISMTSHITFSYAQNLTDKTSASAVYNEQQVAISSAQSDVKMRNLSFALGVGFIF